MVRKPVGPALWPVFARPISLLSIHIPVLAAALLIQLPAIVPENAAEKDPSKPGHSPAGGRPGRNLGSESVNGSCLPVFVTRSSKQISRKKSVSMIVKYLGTI